MTRWPASTARAAAVAESSPPESRAMVVVGVLKDRGRKGSRSQGWPAP